jgi:tetratricopeptide (TPR) repeat protein
MKRFGLAAALAATTILSAPAFAAEPPISLRDSFRIGTGAGTVCTAQLASTDKATADMFDRAYAVTCRDASAPVGRLYALKLRGQDPATRLAGLRGEKASCQPGQSRQVEGLPPAEVIDCTLSDAQVGYRAYTVRDRGTLYVAEGLAGYDSALRLGLRTLLADKPVAGEVQVAITEAGDPASFARVQAGTLDPQRALAEAYRRNNAGNYAEAAEFFGSIMRSQGGSQAEALANEALQQSNLGNHAEANTLFERAAAAVGTDPVLTRMLRNYRTMHLLNQRRTRQALAELDRAVPRYTPPGSSAISELVIDKAIAAQLNADSSVARQLGSAGSGLLPEEKALILDAQGEYLRGTALRLQNQPQQAVAPLNQALARLTELRGGRVTSTVWMRAQILGELASLAEQSGNNTEAERQHRAAVALLEANYPTSSALRNTQARFASFYARTGQTEPALALFKQIVDANADSASASPALREGLAPYFALLAERGTDRQSVADMFKASQIMVRPGVAQTQAGAGPRTLRRQRRSLPPVPPGRHPHPRHRAQTRSRSAACRRSPNRARPTAGAWPSCRRSSPPARASRSRRRPSSRNSRATASSPAVRSASRSCRRSFATARPITKW